MNKKFKNKEKMVCLYCNKEQDSIAEDYVYGGGSGGRAVKIRLANDGIMSAGIVEYDLDGYALEELMKSIEEQNRELFPDLKEVWLENETEY